MDIPAVSYVDIAEHGNKQLFGTLKWECRRTRFGFQEDFMAVTTRFTGTCPISTDIIAACGEVVEQPITLSENALTVLGARYLKKNESGEVVEEPEDMFHRVAGVIAGAEDLFGEGARQPVVETLFYNMMASGEFLPNSPTLMNAGRDLGAAIRLLRPSCRGLYGVYIPVGQGCGAYP